MMARFFIDRPVLAWVISIIIVLMGLISAALLPLAQYPQITPPTVRVTANYPGANAKVVADTVAAPVEQQINGVENMLYMSSQSSNDGSYILDVTFELGTDLNMAQVLVQNRVALAQPVLPDVVKASGVSVKKRSPDILLIVNLVSENNPNTGKPYYDTLYMSNYATIQLLDALATIERRRRRIHVRRTGLQFARVGRSQRVGRPRVVCQRRRQCAPRAERASRGGANRAGARAERAELSIHGEHARAAHQPGTVWRHHRGDRRRWQGYLFEGRGPH